MSKFKVGDIVKCIDASDSLGNLEEGRLYVVDEVLGYSVKLSSTDGEWFNSRFELVVSRTLDSKLEPEIAYSEASAKTFPYSLHISGTKITGELTEQQLDGVLNILVKGK